MHWAELGASQLLGLSGDSIYLSMMLEGRKNRSERTIGGPQNGLTNIIINFYFKDDREFKKPES